jgi:RNA polymerase-interacting CarD/CdnL/TRCF family regulator
MLRESQLKDIIRKPMGLAEARKILGHLSTWKGKVSNQWKTRANAHQLKMEAGEPLRYAEVFKSLKARQQDGTLSAADRTHLKQCSDLLAEEVANAMGKTRSEALDQLSEAAHN